MRSDRLLRLGIAITVPGLTAVVLQAVDIDVASPVATYLFLLAPVAFLLFLFYQSRGALLG